MVELKIKPLSVNAVWQGKRFKTPKYREYEKVMMLILPPLKKPNAPYFLEVTFGMSLLSDIDNPLKPFLDCLQKKYGINDRDIYTLVVNKDVVKKGNEYIKFKLSAKPYESLL